MATYIASAATGVASLGSANVAVTKPGSVADGHLLVAHCASSAAVTWTTPAGWNLAVDLTGCKLYWKVASGEGATWTFTRNGTTNAAAVHVTAWSGAHPTSPISVSSGVANANATSIALPSVSPAGSATLGQMVCILVSGRTWTPPGTTTERYDAGASGTAHVAAGGDEEVSAGATGTRTWTPSGAANNRSGIIFAIAPAPPPNQGSATGGYSESGAGASGSVTRAGSSSGGFAEAGTGGTGSAPRAGTASGAYSEAGAGSGASSRSGSGSGSLLEAGEASGSSDRSGGATGGLSESGGATGSRSSSGSVMAEYTASGSASGQQPPNTGSSAGEYSLSDGQAAGSSPSGGDATGWPAWSGTGSGSRDAAGSSSPAFSVSGSAAGSSPNGGSASGASAASGSATGSSPNGGTASEPMSWAAFNVRGRNQYGGDADGAWLLQGAASGGADRSGQAAASSLSLLGAATGSRQAEGQAATAEAWAAAVTGYAPPPPRDIMVSGAVGGQRFDASVSAPGTTAGVRPRRLAASVNP